MSATQVQSDLYLYGKNVGTSVGKLYFTEDLSIFKLMKGNRNPNMNHVKKIAYSYQKDGVKMSPIIVNMNFEVVDGQHRLLAAIEAGVGIYFVIAPDYNLKEVHILNANQKKWSPIDHVEAGVDLGIDHYKKLKKLINKYPNISVGSFIILSSGVNNGSTQSIKDGSYEFKANWDDVCEFLDLIHEMEDYLEFWNTVRFVNTLITLSKKESFSLSAFVEKVKKYPHMMEKRGSNQQYIDLIEKLYNHRNRNKVSIRY